MNIDDIKYGNPAQSHVDKVEADRAGLLHAAIEAGVIDDILTNHPFPPNSSLETRRELEDLAWLAEGATPAEAKACTVMEHLHFHVFQKVGEKIGINVSVDELKDWTEDISPILYYLKDKFNRPRPYQLADYMDIPLYPIVKTDASSASYPSGHVMDFLTIIHYFKKQKPEASKLLDDFYEQIKRIREVSGVHYPSDRYASEVIFQKLIENNIIN